MIFLNSDDGGAIFDTTSVSLICLYHRDALLYRQQSVRHCHPPLVATTELLVEKGDYFLMSHDNDTVKFECNHVLVIYVVLCRDRERSHCSVSLLALPLIFICIHILHLICTSLFVI